MKLIIKAVLLSAVLACGLANAATKVEAPKTTKSVEEAKTEADCSAAGGEWKDGACHAK